MAEKHRFESTGEDFSAGNAAEKWCQENGISVGPVQAYAPRGLVRGDAQIAKWRNLGDEDKAALSGMMTGSMRHGPVVVELFA